MAADPRWHLPEDRYFNPDPTQRRVAMELYESAARLPIVSPHGHVNPRLFADEHASFGSPADLLIIPVQAEYYATISLKRMIKLVKLVQSKTNPNLSYKLLITMYDRRNKICNVIKDRMQQKMGHWLYHTIIEVDTKLRESPAFGQPITTYAPQTRGAQQYRALAREVTRS